MCLPGWKRVSLTVALAVAVMVSLSSARAEAVEPKIVDLTVALAAAVTLSSGPARAEAAESKTLVVDRDRVECANARFTSIQAAVDAANPGDTVRVCPDIYSETIVVDKPLTLRGQPDAVEAVDCLAPTPSQLDDLDPTQHAILDSRGATDLVMLTLAANTITLEGFVLQGAANPVLPSDYRLFRRAVDTSDAYAGYRVTHNLIRRNTVGIQFGSAGEVESRIDHNCIRDNLWGLAADDRTLDTARVDHNTTFKNTQIAFEPALATVTDLVFDHNVSRQDGFSYLIQHSTDSRIEDNTIESARIGIVVWESNHGLVIGRNTISNPPGATALQGIAFRPIASDAGRNTGALVYENVVTGMSSSTVGDGIITAPPTVAAPNGVVSDSSFIGNVTTDNNRDGMRFAGGTNNVVRTNVSLRNGRYGIYASAARQHRFEGNQMLENRVYDAVDESDGSNTWLSNVCVSDYPAGTICGSVPTN